MPKSSTSQTVAGLRRVIDWLTQHPELPVARVDYASNDVIELTLESGGYELLAAAIKAADSIDEPEISVADASTDPDAPRQWCQLLVSGWLPAGNNTRAVRAVIAGICFDRAAVALRNSLGAPPIPGERIWDTTGEHLASLIPSSVPAGA